MQIVLLTHPQWFGSLSMPRFAEMLQAGLTERGHEVSLVTAQPRLQNKLGYRSGCMGKWVGYADQFLIFPRELRRLAKRLPADTLFVFADHALGAWAPAVRDRPHVIHCHDFLAQRSALGQFAENPTGFTGQQYQALIRRGYSQGKAFISVSRKTQSDLHKMLGRAPCYSEVVYNGLRGDYSPIDKQVARDRLDCVLRGQKMPEFLLHIGGNQWYKNRIGVLEIYREWRRSPGNTLPLWMIGPAPDSRLGAYVDAHFTDGSVRFLVGLDDDQVKAAYNLATLFLFPSLEEGFGWPISEAMASGTPVLTTDSAPMNEVGGNAAIYHFRRTASNREEWARTGAARIEEYIALPAETKQEIISKGLKQASQFDHHGAIDGYERCYCEVVEKWGDLCEAAHAR